MTTAPARLWRASFSIWTLQLRPCPLQMWCEAACGVTSGRPAASATGTTALVIELA